MPGKRTEFDYEDIEPYVHTLRRVGLVQHVLGLLRTWRDDMRTLQGEMVQRPVQMPTLLIWGERDIVVPLSTAAKLMQYLERPSLVSMHKVGHVANEEAPVETALAIHTWLEEQGL
jgi:pimeloyl-ACP methyl ester carboxylesterase